MNPALATPFKSLDEVAALTPQQIVELIGALRRQENTEALLRQEITALKQQLDWFKRQLFGQKSERRIETGPNGQMSFGECLPPPTLPAPPGQQVAAHTRKPATRRQDDEAVPFFDESRVPVEVIELAAPEADGLAPKQYEVISHKESYRLAQRPGSYEPIYEAQFASIRESRVKAMDETPIKAGQAGPGKLKKAYFWPVYGELDEICFPFFPSREIKHVEAALGLTPAERAVLLSDGYHAYAHYATKTGITHAQCWTHTRRNFFEAQTVEPEAAGQALELIGALYQVEESIREEKLSGAGKRDYRLAHAKPVVERFFAWIGERFAVQGLLPSNPLTKALAYARDRRCGLEVFLTDPDVPIDTNHLERALRVVPMGRKNWLFCWTELGAKQVGIIHSLIATSRLHQIDPYDYLVDVLQRVGRHPAERVRELTPRLRKQLFAADPLRAPLYRLGT